jgi:hypothetical protein
MAHKRGRALAVTITDIKILRDGGTILFTLSGVANVGNYRLQTPFDGEPRPIFFNESRLEFGSAGERELAVQLEAWLRQNLTEDSQKAIDALDILSEWRNLSKPMREVIPLHHIRTVLRCLRRDDRSCASSRARPSG